MQLKDLFNFNDLARTALLGSALFFLIGTFYSVFLHAMYASQVDQVKQDILAISDLMTTKSTMAYAADKGELSRQYKDISDKAKKLANKIRAPPVSPSTYTYLNYWLSSAAFTDLYLSPEVLGLPPETIDAFNTLTNEDVLGKKGWWNHPEFRGVDLRGEYRQFLESPPKLQTHFWSFYIFVFIIAIFTIFFATKEKYEFPVLPEIIYGTFMPVLFFVIFTFTSFLSLIGLIKFLDPSQVDIMVSFLVFVIMSVLCAFGALIAAFLRIKLKKVEI